MKVIVILIRILFVPIYIIAWIMNEVIMGDGFEFDLKNWILR